MEKSILLLLTDQLLTIDSWTVMKTANIDHDANE